MTYRLAPNQNILGLDIEVETARRYVRLRVKHINTQSVLMTQEFYVYSQNRKADVIKAFGESVKSRFSGVDFDGDASTIEAITVHVFDQRANVRNDVSSVTHRY